METPANEPLARRTELTVEPLSEETIIYDHKRHRVHCLNRTLTFVWQQCDGKTTIPEMAGRLPGAVGLPADQDIVRLAIRQLSDIHLLTGDTPVSVSNAIPSRRQLVRKLAVLGVSAPVLLPSVSSIVAPTAAMAASGPPDDHGKDDKDKSNNGKNNNDNSNNGKGNGRGNG
jgi:hypothetical protein